MLQLRPVMAQISLRNCICGSNFATGFHPPKLSGTLHTLPLGALQTGGGLRMKKFATSVLVLALATTSLSCSNMSNTQKGAGTGAAAGGVIGGIIGHQSGNTAVGAIIGAAVGGAAGG